MADYALKYYKTYKLNGHIIQLNIYKKYPAVKYAPAPMEIGRVLQGLLLDVQGEQDDIIAPYIKTSLSMTFADAPGAEEGKKCGDWEEFYTPDSTAYKVILSIDGKTYWSGYITPDSFEEELEYRGSVTLVARDNIGHLQDFDFDVEGDEYGMISVRELIDSALAKVDCLLSLEYAEGYNVVWPVCNDFTALDCVVNVEAFEEKNWLEALDAVLDSFGLALRFVGYNKVVIMPLRSLPCLDKGRLSRVEVKDILLQASGHRSLVAAAKQIKDVGKYDVEKEVQLKNVKKKDFSGRQSTYRCKIEGVNFGILEHDAPVWPISQRNKGWNNPIASKTSFFNVYNYDLGYFLKRAEDEASVKGDALMYIAANNVDERSVEYKQRILCKPFELCMRFGEPIGLTNSGELESYSGTSLHLKKIIYQIIVEDEGGEAKHWNGNSWVNAETDVTVEYDVNYGVTEFSSVVNFNGIESESLMMTFRIKKIEYYAVGYTGVPDVGIYARVLEFVIKVPDDIAIMEESIVNSIYDESLNYLINRESDLVAPLQTFVVPKIVQNGIYLPTSGNPAAAKWNWPGESETSLQALIAQQILMYYSQPNSIITGTLLALENKGEILDFNCLWRWRNKKLMLISGQLDLMTGFIENAKLREYLDWAKLWPTEGYLITEDGNDVLTEDDRKVVVAKIYYNLISESARTILTEDDRQITLNGKS